MNIDRHKDQGGKDVALKRLGHCLDMLEKYGFEKKFDWDTEIANHCTLEEIVGAMIAAEQVLTNYESSFSDDDE